MKNKYYLRYLGIALILCGCTSTPHPTVAKPDYRIRFTTEMELGNSFTLYVNAEQEDQGGVWLDRNNNGIQDANEKITVFEYGKNGELTFPLESQRMTLYGKVTVLGCSANKLVSLEVHENPALEYLVCSQNSIRSLNLHTNTRLKVLNCRRNQLYTLDVSDNTALEELWCDINYITVLDVSKNTELTTLWCIFNQLTALDVSRNKNLKELACSINPLKLLDVRANTQLESIDCGANELTELDISRNRLLKELSCSFNRLTDLDLHNNPKLEMLDISGNQFALLDVSANPALNDVKCAYNKLAGEGMETFIRSIPLCTADTGGEITMIDTSARDKNVCTTAQVKRLKAKNRTVYYYDGYFGSEKIYKGSDADTIR